MLAIYNQRFCGHDIEIFSEIIQERRPDEHLLMVCLPILSDILDSNFKIFARLIFKKLVHAVPNDCTGDCTYLLRNELISFVLARH